MKRYSVKRLLSLALLAVMLLTLTACGEAPKASVKVESYATEPITDTAANPLEATLDSLFSIMSSDMKWSYLSDYIHTNSVPGNADFVVKHGDKTLSLHVLFDEVNDVVSVADLTFGTTTVSLLSDNRNDMRPLLEAINEG